jgi:hypothetical protein
MHRLRSAPLAEDFAHSARQQTQRVGLGQTPAGPVGLASSAAPFVPGLWRSWATRSNTWRTNTPWTRLIRVPWGALIRVSRPSRFSKRSTALSIIQVPRFNRSWVAGGGGFQGCARLVGALCFSRGEQRFSVAEESWTLICALARASKNPGLKPIFSE